MEYYILGLLVSAASGYCFFRAGVIYGKTVEHSYYQFTRDVVKNQRLEFDKLAKIHKELKEHNGRILGTLRALRRQQRYQHPIFGNGGSTVSSFIPPDFLLSQSKPK